MPIGFVCVLNVLMQRLQTFESDRAIDMLSAGRSVRNVARMFNVNHGTISRLRDQFPATGNFNGAPQSRRPRSLSKADD